MQVVKQRQAVEAFEPAMRAQPSFKMIEGGLDETQEIIATGPRGVLMIEPAADGEQTQFATARSPESFAFA